MNNPGTKAHSSHLACVAAVAVLSDRQQPALLLAIAMPCISPVGLPACVYEGGQVTELAVNLASRNGGIQHASIRVSLQCGLAILACLPLKLLQHSGQCGMFTTPTASAEPQWCVEVCSTLINGAWQSDSPLRLRCCSCGQSGGPPFV